MPNVEIFATVPESMMTVPSFIQQGTYYLATFTMMKDGEGVYPIVIHLYKIERVTDINKVIFSDMIKAYDNYERADSETLTFFYTNYELKLTDLKVLNFVEANNILSTIPIRYVVKGSSDLEDGIN